MTAIVNGTRVVINYNPETDLKEWTENGEIPVLIGGHEEAQKFLETLERLGTDAGCRLEDLMNEIYRQGVMHGRKSPIDSKSSDQPRQSLGFRR